MRSKAIKDGAIRLAGRLGLHMAKRTRVSAVEALIRALRPLDSGVPLVRLGPDGDGGYLVPNDLAGIDYAFSPGVSNESGFEAALANRGARIFLADFSVDRPAQEHPQFAFTKKFVGCVSNDMYITLDEWKSSNLPDHGGDLLLQMDIEGAEYETLMSASPALLAQFRIMVIEFHYLQDLWNRPVFELASWVFRKLLQTHSVVHIHPNNCCGSVKSRGLEIPRIAEFTFYRNDRLRQQTYAQTFPHSLDRDNTRKPTLPLPAYWYR
jgi:hypothetical protein